MKDLERVLYYEAYIVKDPGMASYDSEGTTPLAKFDVLNEEQYQSITQRFPDSGLDARMGGEIVQELLADLDLVDMFAQPQRGHSSDPNQKRRGKDQLLSVWKVIESFLDSGKQTGVDDAYGIACYATPIFDLWVSLDGGKFAVSDVNDLYRRVINRNQRLKKIGRAGCSLRLLVP